MSAFLRRLFLVPVGAEHTQVAAVAPLGVLLSGGEELVCLFFGNCFATETKHEAEQAYRNSVRGTV